MLSQTFISGFAVVFGRNMDFLGGSESEVLPAMQEGNGSPLHYSCLENPVNRGAWRSTVHGLQRVGHN